MATVEVIFPDRPTGSTNALDTIAELRAVDSSAINDNTNIIVVGAGIYKWNAASLASDNGSSVIKPTDKTALQAGRWILIIGMLSAADYSGTVFLSSAVPVWLGNGTYNGSTDPMLVVSRLMTTAPLGSPHAISVNFVSSFGGGLSQNAYDDRSRIIAGAMNHHASYQSGLELSGTANMVQFFHDSVQVTLDGPTANLDNLYGMFVREVVELNGANFVGRIVGLFVNGVPETYTAAPNISYSVYSSGTARGFNGGQWTSASLVASALEITAGARIHANTPNGTACGIRWQQQDQNWWEWRSVASQTYGSLFNATGGGSGTEQLRIASSPGHFSPGSVNTQDCGTDALPWRQVHADTGFYILGNKVVGAQGAAVADATDAATAITQLNAWLARSRAHGLIAT